jgi:hypothetical protein
LRAHQQHDEQNGGEPFHKIIFPFQRQSWRLGFS